VGTRALRCFADSDCSIRANGRCDTTIMTPGCDCSYDECFSDSDCSTGGPCACRATGVTTGLLGNRCLAGNCRTDSDCGYGNYCSPTVGFDCGPYTVVGYYCHHPKDACLNDNDCAHGDCRYNPASGAWTCETGVCTG
jgi:Cys-rich repeat protein